MRWASLVGGSVGLHGSIGEMGQFGGWISWLDGSIGEIGQFWWVDQLVRWIHW